MICTINRFISTAGALCLGSLIAVSASADDFNWDVAGPADWNDGANWFNSTTATPMAGPPSGGLGNAAFVNNGGTAEVSADIPEIQDPFIGTGAGNSGTLNQTGGAINNPAGGGSWMFVGQNGGTGTYNLSGGSVGKDRLYIGTGANGNGTLNLSGTGAVANQFLILGDAGATGVANVTGGSVHATSEIWVGQGGGGSGELNQSSGVVEADTWIAIGRDSATGVVNLSGDAVLRKVATGDAGNSDRSFITVGGLGAGSGGTVNIEGNAVLESDTNLILAESAGRYGVVNQSGGSVILHDNLANPDGFNDSLELDYANEGLGVYNLSGGSLHAETIDATTGTFAMSGGLLSATNYVGNLVQAGGTVSPGNSPGTMTITGDYSLDSGDLYMEIEGVLAGTGYDQLIVTGDVSLDGALTLDGAYVPNPGEFFTLIDNQGANAVAGTFSGLAEGSTVTFNGFDLTVTYAGGDGNDVVLFSIPEPTSLALLAVVGLAGAVSRRR